MADLRLSLPEDDGHGSGRSGGIVSEISLKKLGADLKSLLETPDEEYSDLSVVVEGKRLAVHRCILGARCSGLRQAIRELEQNGNAKLELELSSVVDRGKIGYDAFVAVMRFVYGGKLEPWPARIACYDAACAHLTCRPAIDYVLEILCAALLLCLPEVKIVAEQYLMDNMRNLEVDDMLRVHRSASTSECSQLQSVCLAALASSTLDNVTLDKEFSGASLEEVRKLRVNLGLDVSHLAPLQEMQCKRIHRALDSDDVELVRMLVDEKKLDLDGAHGLHYAAAYCHPRTLSHLLELNIADSNARNERGMTVLHIAAWRREPQSIANLLEKGAQPKALTRENRTALDILRRLAKKTNLDGEEEENERICITILEQAEKKHTIVVPKSATAMLSSPSTEKELMSQLLYLENRGKLSAQKFLNLYFTSVTARMREYNRDKSSKRYLLVIFVNVGATPLIPAVALARLLYPREADIVMGISHLDSYAAFTGVHMKPPGSGIASRRSKPSVDLNEDPAERMAGLVGVTVGDQSKEGRVESLRQRCDALRKAVETGRKCFPCYAAVIDKYVLDDDYVEPNDEGNIEEQLLKKRHFAELKGILQDSFPKAKVDEHRKMGRHKQPRTQEGPLSSSSTSSSRGTSDSMGSRTT